MRVALTTTMRLGLAAARGSSRQAQGLGWLGACCGWTVLDALAKQKSNLPVAGFLAEFLTSLKLARVGLGLLVLALELSTLGLAVASLLVDVHFLTVLGGRRLRAAAFFLVDADLFLDVRVAGRLLRRLLLLLLVDGGREGFVRLFVTFPSVCLLLG